MPATAIGKLTFGDELSHPITVLAAEFHTVGLPQLGGALVRATLTVCNAKVDGDVKATLRFPLPDGAAVCGYSFETEHGMIDAFAVSKHEGGAAIAPQDAALFYIGKL